MDEARLSSLMPDCPQLPRLIMAECDESEHKLTSMLGYEPRLMKMIIIISLLFCREFRFQVFDIKKFLFLFIYLCQIDKRKLKKCYLLSAIHPTTT